MSNPGTRDSSDSCDCEPGIDESSKAKSQFTHKFAASTLGNILEW